MASASGTYVRTSINGPNLLGNRKFSFVIKYWSSSSSVWNSDGQEINVKITANGSSQTINLGTLYGSNLGKYTSEDNAWSYTYTYTASVVVNGFSICSITKDKNNDGNFYAATGNINVVQAKITAPAINSTTTIFPLHKTSWFYSMRILQGKDKRFIIIFIFNYLIIRYHINIYLRIH